jgi:Na+-transporting NADH:ubiquinone oxidoreductase subunit NqrD
MRFTLTVSACFTQFIAASMLINYGTMFINMPDTYMNIAGLFLFASILILVHQFVKVYQFIWRKKNV